MRQILIVLFSITILVSCSDEPSNNFSYLPDAVGGYNTVNVIADESVWNLGFKRNVSKLFEKDIKGLFNKEPEFDFNTVRSKAFNRLFQRQKFILLLVVSPKVLKPGISIKHDVYANGQIVVQVAAKTDEKVIELFTAQSVVIFKAFDDHRTKIIQALAKKENNKRLEEKLYKNQKINLTVPASYKLAKDTLNFNYFVKKVQMKCEKFKHNNCYVQSGIMVYSFPYTTSAVFDADKLMEIRDSITKQYIGAPPIIDSLPAYMKTMDEFPFEEEKLNLNNQFAYEVSGWWDVENGTMGGPFVCVAIVDEKQNRVIVADGYVFAPNFNKRRFIKELEAVCLTIQAN